jgi:hypothetical protein
MTPTKNVGRNGSGGGGGRVVNRMIGGGSSHFLGRMRLLLLSAFVVLIITLLDPVIIRSSASHTVLLPGVDGKRRQLQQQSDNNNNNSSNNNNSNDNNVNDATDGGLFLPDSFGDTMIYNNVSFYFDGTTIQSYLAWVELHYGTNCTMPSSSSSSSSSSTVSSSTQREADSSNINNNGIINNCNSFYMPSLSDPSLGIAVHYHIDEETQRIYLGLVVRATGWLGFGISESGGMPGSDVLIFETSNPEVIIDAHIMDVRLPVADDCQDWVLTSSTMNLDEEFIMITAYRALDTGDLQDARIVNDNSNYITPDQIIAAWGDDVEFTYHGTVNRAQGSIRWFRQDPDESDHFRNVVSTTADGSFMVQAMNYVIPTQETTYQHFCFSRDDLIELGAPLDEHESISIIAVAAYINPTAIEHVQYVVTV